MRGEKCAFWPATHFLFSQQARGYWWQEAFLCWGIFCSLLPDGVLAAGRIEAHLQNGPETHEMSFWQMEKNTHARHTENVKHAEMNRTVLEEISGVASTVKGVGVKVFRKTLPRPFSLSQNS
jgi:hypothetical protein